MTGVCKDSSKTMNPLLISWGLYWFCVKGLLVKIPDTKISCKKQKEFFI